VFAVGAVMRVVLLLAILAVALAAPITPVSEASLKQLQSTFNIPCSACTTIIGQIEIAGEEHCIDVLTLACNKFHLNCSQIELTIACGIIKTLLENETPDKICNDYIHCTPGMSLQAQTSVAEIAFKQLQAAFNIPCPMCISTVTLIEQEGEAHCVELLTKACSALKKNCSPTAIEFACSVIKGMLQVETPTKICNFFKCSPQAMF
jgi:hypothetical protein